MRRLCSSGEITIGVAWHVTLAVIGDQLEEAACASASAYARFGVTCLRQTTAWQARLL